MFKYVAGRLRLPNPAINPADPLHLNLLPQQLVNKRYRILNRLGQGTQSTVWLAEELTQAKKTVAVKVLTDYVSSLQEEYAFELRVMKRISRLPESSAGVRNLPRLFDHFMLPGIRGNHLCLVTDVFGPSVLDIAQVGDQRAALPPDVVKHLTRQILKALVALHDDCGVVHTDIKPDNLLFTRSTLSSSGTFDPRRMFDTDNLVLSDYGVAMPLDSKVDRLVQPEALRCPEVLLGCEWGVKADIWNLGCIVFELLTSRALFRPAPFQQFSAQQYHLARMFGTLADDSDYDRLQEFFRSGRKYDHFFTEDGKMWLTIGKKYRESLQQILEIYGVYTPDLLEFLTAMLRVHPEDRLPARDLLTLPWLRE